MNILFVGYICYIVVYMGVHPLLGLARYLISRRARLSYRLVQFLNFW